MHVITYSVFTNEYWKIASEPLKPEDLLTVTTDGSTPVPQVTVPDAVEITDFDDPPTVTATACFTVICAQWYQTDAFGSPNGTYYKPIPGETGMSYTLPNPVPCEMLNAPYGYVVVEVFDEGRVPHVSKPIRLFGVCQP